MRAAVYAQDRETLLYDLDLVDRRAGIAIHPEDDHAGAHRRGVDGLRQDAANGIHHHVIARIRSGEAVKIVIKP